MGRVAALEGLENATGLLEATGTVTARVTQVRSDGVTLSWGGDLDVGGNITIPAEEMLEAQLEGQVSVFHEEQRSLAHVLPLAFEDENTFELTISAGFLVPYAATLRVHANMTPGEDYPVYPLGEGTQAFSVPTHLTTALTFTVFGIEFSNSSEEQVTSVVQLEVRDGGTLTVPAGTFATTEVILEALEGLAPGPLQALFPGAVQVAAYAPEVGNAVRIQFFLQDQEIGNATLQSFQYGTENPLWQNPLVLGGLLAIPVVVLLYLYLRERRKGL